MHIRLLEDLLLLPIGQGSRSHHCQLFSYLFGINRGSILIQYWMNSPFRFQSVAVSLRSIRISSSWALSCSPSLSVRLLLEKDNDDITRSQLFHRKNALWWRNFAQVSTFSVRRTSGRQCAVTMEPQRRAAISSRGTVDRIDNWLTVLPTYSIPNSARHLYWAFYGYMEYTQFPLAVGNAGPDQNRASNTVVEYAIEVRYRLNLPDSQPTSSSLVNSS